MAEIREGAEADRLIWVRAARAVLPYQPSPACGRGQGLRSPQAQLGEGLADSPRGKALTLHSVRSARACPLPQAGEGDPALLRSRLHCFSSIQRPCAFAGRRQRIVERFYYFAYLKYLRSGGFCPLFVGIR